MNVVNYPENGNNQVGANGECPHCGVVSYFRPVASSVDTNKVVSAAKCESCKGFVLVLGNRLGGNQACQSITVYPLGKPNETVDPAVPASVSEDFKEALRCHFIKSYRATVVMCRRAIQQSAIELKATGNKLINQIDDLYKNGKITESLKDFAHEVRLTGNDGAHPDKDGLADVNETDSNEIIEFTREYLHHVYVMPAKLAARKLTTAPSPTPVAVATTVV